MAHGLLVSNSDSLDRKVTAKLKTTVSSSNEAALLQVELFQGQQFLKLCV